MDVYIEELMPKNKDKSDWIFIVSLIISGVLVTGILIWVLLFMMIATKNILSQFVVTLVPLAIAGVWYGVYRLCNTRSVEYEYTVINSELDIDKVMSRKTRKKCISVDIKNATQMAKVDDKEAKIPNTVKIYDYSALNKNLDTYFIECTVKGENCIILFQPTSRMVEALWKFNPKVVKRYNV